MKKARVLLIAALCLSLSTALFALTACGGGGGGGVAATVNGTEIMEQDVTDAIESMRAQSVSYTDDTSWAQALSASGLTPESLRESVIETKARVIIVSQEAEAQGYTVNDEDIDAQVADTKETVGGDDATWLETLQQYGYKDEQAFRDSVVASSLETQLYDNFEVSDPTDEELAEYISQNPTAVEGWSLAEGVTEEAPVEEVVDEGVLEVEAGEEGAEVVDEVLPEEITTEETPTYTAEDVDLSTIPEDVRAEYKQMWIDSNKGTKYNEWIDELIENADIVINDMPEDVSYNVDMSLAEDTSTGEEDVTVDETPTSSFSSAEAVEAALAEGLIIEDIAVGEGDEAHDGDTVRVLYTGTLEDGTVFDSTANRDNEPLEFTLGVGGVIKGWDAGVVGMKVGGTRTLTIPASLAYGDTGSTNVPAGATLTFEIELLEVTHADH